MDKSYRNNYIGENIRHYREKIGISQSELARRIGKTPGAISQYEAGVNVPRMPIVEKMADVLGCRVSDIFEPDMGLLDAEDVLHTYQLTYDEVLFIEKVRAKPQEKREQLFRIAGTL